MVRFFDFFHGVHDKRPTRRNRFAQRFAAKHQELKNNRKKSRVNMKVYLSCSEECSNSTPCSQPRREAPVKNSDAVQITSSEVSVPLCISYLRVRRSAMYAQHGSAGVHQRHAYNLPRHTKSRQHSHGKNICVLSLSHTHSLPPPLCQISVFSLQHLPLVYAGVPCSCTAWPSTLTPPRRTNRHAVCP